MSFWFGVPFPLETKLGKIIGMLWFSAIVIIITNANFGVTIKCDEEPPYYGSSDIVGLSCSHLNNVDFDDHDFPYRLENVVVFPSNLSPDRNVINYFIMVGFISCFALAAYIPVFVFEYHERKRHLLLFKYFYKNMPGFKSSVFSENAVRFATKCFLEKFQRRQTRSCIDTSMDIMVWFTAAIQVTYLYIYLVNNYLIPGLTSSELFDDPLNAHQTMSCAYPVSLTNETLATCEVHMGYVNFACFFWITVIVVFFLVFDLIFLFTSLLRYLVPRTTALHFPMAKIDPTLGKKLRYANWRELYRISLALKPEEFQLFLEEIQAKIPDEVKHPKASKPDVIISLEKVNFIQVDKVDKEVLANK